MMNLKQHQLHNIITTSLLEDLGLGGDLTTNLLLAKNQVNIKFEIINKDSNIIFCGSEVVDFIFQNFSNLKYSINFSNGNVVGAREIILKGYGCARELLQLERVLLNYLQHLCGISTLTAQFVNKISGTQTKVCDTRKTIPGLRTLQKYAVYWGGGVNHRFTLDNCIFIKDNHIKLAGGILNAIRTIKNNSPPYFAKFIVECENIQQVSEALEENVDSILLDNMSISKIKASVELINNSAIIEASGGVTLDNIQEVAQQGVDYISVGRLTHSVTACDLSLNII